MIEVARVAKDRRGQERKDGRKNGKAAENGTGDDQLELVAAAGE